MDNLHLKALANTDIDLLTTWLNKEYIIKWYNDPNEWLEEVNERHSTYSWINHFIVMDGDIPIGFCQYYDCYDANDMEDWYEVKESGDTFSIDYLIGDESYLGKGYGKAIIKLLTETIWQKEQVKQIIVQPDENNHASNHVLMANGYLYDKSKSYYYKTRI